MYKFKRIFAIFLSVLLLSLAVGDAFISTNDISHVQATGAEVVAGAAAADAVWKFLVALFAAIGLGGAAVENKDAVVDSYVNYLDAQIATDEYIIDQAINLYNSASDVVRSIPIDELMDSLENYHDSAVDTLIGIYAQYCPELIGITKDFVEDVAAKNITIAGVTDVFSTPMTAETVAQQWSGEPFLYTSECHGGYVGFGKQYYTVDHAYSGTLSVPICARYFVDEGTHTNSNHQLVTIPWHHLSFYFLNEEGQVTGVALPGIRKIYLDGLLQSSVSNEVGGFSFLGSYDYPERNVFSYSLNFPVFSSMIDVEAYLKGTGAVTDALNYSTDIADYIIENDDLPTIGGFADELWERVARAPDCGIGSYGSGSLVGDWADDIPWLGLGDLDDFVNSIQDVFEKTIEGILDGTYDLPLDIPDYTYGDAWIDVVDRTWDDVIDNPVNNPAIDKPDNPAVGDKDDPITSDKDTTISIDIPADDLVPTMNDSLGDIAGNLRYKFPFSIPWDIRHVFQVLADTPKAPRFELPLVIKRFDIDERIIVDMAMFQVLSNLSRSLFSMLFGMYLMNLTFKVVSMRKEE